MIKETPFGELYGVDVVKYTLCGVGGLAVSVINYGATITNVLFEGHDVVLGYDDLEGYLKIGGYLGSTVGRYGNRIGKGTFMLDGKKIDVGCNENEFSHLHGGYVGFDKQLWDVVGAGEGDEPYITFSHVFDDMEEGYPGELDVNVTFTVTKDNALRIEYKAISSKKTVFNPTNHSYFNLAGYDGGNILDTELYINADSFTPYDCHLIPTGEIRAVDGTPFDFRTPKAIGKDINADDEQIHFGGGYDHNFCLRGDDDSVKIIAYSKKSGIEMSVKTTEPGVQLYTSNMLTSVVGKGGAHYKHQAFCLETQHYPDSPNHDNFPSTVLEKETPFYSVTEYIFKKR